MNPRVTDNDQGEITVTLDGKELRSWTYNTQSRPHPRYCAPFDGEGSRPLPLDRICA
jgi:hypothetical protein